MSTGQNGTRGLPVAVIGAGFSGTAAAISLSAVLPSSRPILLCERETFACGTAYSTRNANHLLNVRATNMSAFPDEPDHFERWLAQEAGSEAPGVRDTPAGRFASRGLYHRYLRGLLEQACARGTGGLDQLRAEIVDIEPEGEAWRLHAADGSDRLVSGVVLAMGNLRPAPGQSALHQTDPWAADATAGLRPDLPVLVVGTGLTMVDLALEMRDSGFPGPVIAVSRRGLPPQAHQATRPWPTPQLSPAERQSLTWLVRRVRREIQCAEACGHTWRDVLDSLRPLTAPLWVGLPEADRSRFLRHLRPFWDTHRHRMAPPVAEQLARMRADGFLRIRRGRVTGLHCHADRVEVLIRARGAAEPESLVVQRVINASGLQGAGDAENRLVGSLRRRALVRLDPWKFGIDVTESLQVRDTSGRTVPRMWSLGPIVRGVFWECVAVPDIRVQARIVASSVSETFGTA